MKVAWVFPGQGSQSVGMGREIFEVSAAARDVLAKADQALAEPLSKLIAEGPEDTLTLTANTQPAIVTVSCAVLAAMRERVPTLRAPAFAAGHSLGEYSALVAASSLALEDAVRLVRARGRAMQDAVPPGEGAMAAIMGLDPEKVEDVCKRAAQGEVVSPANFNAPGQVVIAGHAAAVARANELASAEKGKAIALKVSAPFHCALMAPAARVLASELDRVSVSPLAFPVVANVDAQPNTDGARVKDLLVRQVDGPVRWEATIRLMASEGVTHILEIGPGKVLAGLIKRISKELKVLSVGDAGSLGQVSSFLDE
ncbi:MAG TPA: ACP S-malonyltransferase [Polyangiaceae bacterium]|jgi:[acyl-carrier-protein] S-malonyltransferase|nr:ACP S-malonyltransferase [Polyangiaceae bacterium]